MSLYVRVFTSFWNHRKTAKLRARIGDDALWLPARLWCYAAENQPDGNFEKYSAEELAMLLGYFKDATSMLQALQEAGFMDGMCIHDWEEHNRFHDTFASRAKKAADARWKKGESAPSQTLPDKTGKDKKGKEQASLKHTSSMLQAYTRPAQEDIEAYVLTLGLPKTDGTACFEKWTGNGWKNGGAPIKDWKATIRSWKLHGYLPSQKGLGGTVAAQQTAKLKMV